MSVLTKTLNRIVNWIEQYRPSYIKYLQPGLSKAEIKEIIKELPIKLPTEIYELYQWRNGTVPGDKARETAWLFENWTFMSLQEAVKRYQEHNSYKHTWKSSPIQNNFSSNSFTIFYNMEDCQAGYLLINANLNECPVIFEDFKGGDNSLIRKYTNLTTMMLTMAECYETGAYYLDKTEYNVYFINWSWKKVYPIWRKYNSDIIELTLQNLEAEPLSSELLRSVADTLIEFQEPKTLEFLIRALQIPLHLDGNFRENTYIKVEAIKILGELGNPESVYPLIAVLENELCYDDYFYDCYLTIRFHVVKALGQLRDKRATYPLICILDDENIEIRTMAAWALGEIKDPKAVKALSQLIEDEDFDVKKAAQEALIKIESEK